LIKITSNNCKSVTKK